MPAYALKCYTTLVKSYKIHGFYDIQLPHLRYTKKSVNRIFKPVLYRKCKVCAIHKHLIMKHTGWFTHVWERSSDHLHSNL